LEEGGRESVKFGGREERMREEERMGRRRRGREREREMQMKVRECEEQEEKKENERPGHPRVYKGLADQLKSREKKCGVTVRIEWAGHTNVLCFISLLCRSIE